MERQKKYLGLVVGENLRNLIKESDLKTQEEFAFRFGTDVRTVSRWINHGIDSLETIQQIADFFDLDVLTILS